MTAASPEHARPGHSRPGHSCTFSLREKVAVVVGAGFGGLGGFASLTLAGHGATVVAVDVADRAAELQRTVAAIAAMGAAAEARHCDVTSEEDVDTLFEEVASSHGHLDVLVNAAGVMLRESFIDTSMAQWDHVVRTNLTGTWLLNRAAGRLMRERGSGRIVNFSTVYAERAGPLPEAAYYASKAAVANLTRAVAAELGPHGVTVNCLAPGVFYPTRMTEPLSSDLERLAWMTERTLLKRLGTPEYDLAGPLLLLASDAGAYVTGQVLYVDGGWSAW